MIFVIITPFIGVLIYMIGNGQGMADRNVKMVEGGRRGDRSDGTDRHRKGSARHRSHQPRGVQGHQAQRDGAIATSPGQRMARREDQFEPMPLDPRVERGGSLAARTTCPALSRP